MGWRLSDRLLASTAWRRLGVIAGCCCCSDFLATLLELSALESMSAGFVPCVTLKGRVGSCRPSCRFCRVAKVGQESRGEGDRRENATRVTEDTSRGCVSWIVLAGDIARMEACASGLCDLVYAAEDVVGLVVPAGTFPPTLDDSCVVSIAFEVEVRPIECDQGGGEELKCDGLCPANVTSLRVPVADKSPRTPMFSHNNSKAHS